MSERSKRTGGTRAPGSASLLSAWQGVLVSEQRAVFGYGLLGAHLHGGPHADLALSCSGAHEDAQRRVRQQLRSRGQVPAAARADYPRLYPVPDASAALSLAIELESGCAAAWRYLYATAADASGTAATADRAPAQAGLNASAARAARWRRIATPRHATVAFPGL